MTERGVPSRRTFLGQTLLGLGGLSGSAEAQPSIPALLAHRSQHGDQIHRQHVQVMEAFRGREAGVAAAEGFASLARPGLV